MKILLLNQTFPPDTVSTAQHLSDLARSLQSHGHQITVLTSRRAYDSPEKLFPKEEQWHGIQIYRVAGTGLGKSARWKRALDFASFLTACTLRVIFLPRQDAIIALTSPPLISVLGAGMARFWRAKFIYWVMDLNPDEAIAAGWLRPASAAAKFLEALSRFSLKSAHRVVALDRFMRDRILAKGIPTERVIVIPPWSHDDQVHFDPAGRAQFRAQHGLDDKFVVMYSGNHSPCHPLDTLLQAALKINQLGANDSASQFLKRIQFVFVGGGSEFKKVQAFAREHRLDNITSLPYQPLERLSASLSAADLQVVIMGEPFVGLVHPCKIYNLLRLGLPILYLGPATSHITDLYQGPAANHLPPLHRLAHGDVDGLLSLLQKLASAQPQAAAPTALPSGPAVFQSQSSCLQRFLALLS
ncbi:MAG: glycosyltransferase family 4 protein [Verrucomicrobiae bacterium]|nr:glycosyltransferase family 4 protein [Verrucomicrobiae bacterium]